MNNKPARLVIDVLNPKKDDIFKEQLKSVTQARKKGNKIIVIDAGHGGEDPGAIGNRLKLKEKNIVLSIARLLHKQLSAYPGITVYLTRKADYYVPLGRRVEIARRYHADLFISIHTNANRKKSYRGSSVYCLSEKGASDKASRLLAKRENASDLIGGTIWAPDNTTKAVLFDISQTSTHNESVIFAKKVIGQFNKLYPLSMDQRVRTAPFAVLKSLCIPSVLVETAFVTNKQEEKLLSSKIFRAKVAGRLAVAIIKYFYGSKYNIYHTVKRGDSLWKIAQLYGLSLQQLTKLNKISKSGTIRPGQKLRIKY